MKLYEFPPTRSLRARWVLQELEIPFESEIVNLRAGENHAPEFLALNPAGKLPVLVDGDFVLTESVAIVLYLAGKHPEKGMLPTDLRERAQVDRWLLFTATELEQPLWRIAHHSFLYPQERRLPEEVELAREDFRAMVPVLAQHLEGRDYLVGDHFTVADVVAAYTLDWANEVGLLEGHPGLVRWMERQYQRPHAPMRIKAAMASVR